MRSVRSILLRLKTLGELSSFLAGRRRLWWLLPFALALALSGLVLLISSQPVVSPVVYTLF